MAAARVCLLGAALVVAENMNGRYSVTSGSRHDVAFNDDYAARGHEFFDVWSPEIATRYGEAFWTDLGNNPLPPHIVARFANKTIAITGYEMDQVFVSPVGSPGLHPENDVSVPLTFTYNHHYMMWLTGARTELIRVPADPDDTSAHGAPTKLVPRTVGGYAPPDSLPSSTLFSEGNGGESRKSFHGYPDGFAQLLHSPTKWHVTPMQIDVRNRDCGATAADVGRCLSFTPGPEPRQARYGLRVPGLVAGTNAGGVPGVTNYSGLLECPCTGRYGGDPAVYPEGGPGGSATKIINHDYRGRSVGACGPAQHVLSAPACFAAAAGLGLNATAVQNRSLHDPAIPRGCTVATDPVTGATAATFNTAPSTAACAPGKRRVGQVTSAVGVTVAFDLDLKDNLATITLSGPADGWFGVGLHALVMADAPYTLIASASGVFEQKIGTCGSEAEHCAGTRLATSVKLVSSFVVDGLRTVKLTRPLQGLTPDHHTFNPATDVTVDIITAVGASQTFAQHKAHRHATLTLVEVGGAPTCVCDDGARGDLCETGGEKCTHFVKQCLPPEHDADGRHYPFGDLLEQRNPTCNSIGYAGGLRCCSHGRILLDADQAIRPELLRYHHKYRFWFQEYKPPERTVGEWSYQPGWLPDGDDVAPPAQMTLEEAWAHCARVAACHAVLLHAPEPRPPANTPVWVHFKGRVGLHALDASRPGWHTYSMATPGSHANLDRLYQQTESYAGEYDVPPAFATPGVPIPGYPNWPLGLPTPGTACTGACPTPDLPTRYGADCECEHTISLHLNISEERLIYAGGHCHAPSCIDIRLYRNDTGTPQLLCEQTTKYGTGDVGNDRFDEAGFVALPPCLWEGDGLDPAPWLPANTPVISVKRNRNTRLGHFGEMASWQMRGVSFPKPPPRQAVRL